MQKLFFPSLFLLFIFPAVILGQDLQPNIAALTEIRSSDPKDAQLRLSIDFGEKKFNEYTRLKYVDGYAIDDLGNRLTSTGNSTFEELTFFSPRFDNPPREASRFKQVVLHIESLQPTEANGAIVRIPAFSEKLGVNLLEGYSDDKHLTFKTVDSLNYHLEFTDAVSGEHASPVQEYSYNPKGLDLSDNAAYFVFNDPDQRILKINLLNGNGEIIDFVGYNSRSYKDAIRKRSFIYDTAIQKDWILEIVLYHEAAVKEHTFKFFDVELY